MLFYCNYNANYNSKLIKMGLLMVKKNLEVLHFHTYSLHQLKYFNDLLKDKLISLTKLFLIQFFHQIHSFVSSNLYPTIRIFNILIHKKINIFQ